MAHTMRVVGADPRVGSILRLGAVLVCALAYLLSAALDAISPGQPLPRVVIETDAGEIEAEIDVVHAPISGANFLKYVDGGYFDGGRFFRTVRADNQPTDKVKIAVIQGEANRDTVREKGGFPAIVLERTNQTGLTHSDGTLSMARSDADTARHSFSIAVGDQPGLDFGSARHPDLQGFAAFGHVVRGMDVVRKINAMTAGGQTGQTLVEPVRIVRVTRVRSNQDSGPRVR